MNSEFLRDCFMFCAKSLSSQITDSCLAHLPVLVPLAYYDSVDNNSVLMTSQVSVSCCCLLPLILHLLMMFLPLYSLSRLFLIHSCLYSSVTYFQKISCSFSLSLFKYVSALVIFLLFSVFLLPLDK